MKSSFVILCVVLSLCLFVEANSYDEKSSGEKKNSVEKKNSKEKKSIQAPKCGINESWSNTCPDCPEQCDNIGKSRCKGSKPGCACVSGHVRERKGGKCIKKTSCKKY